MDFRFVEVYFYMMMLRDEKKRELGDGEKIDLQNLCPWAVYSIDLVGILPMTMYYDKPGAISKQAKSVITFAGTWSSQ